MTMDEFKREYSTEVKEQESEIMFEPIIENNKMIGVIAKFFCPHCKEWELMQIYTDGMNQSLEEAVIDMGLRDEPFDDDEDDIEDEDFEDDEDDEFPIADYEKAYKEYYSQTNKNSPRRRRYLN